MIIDTFVAPPCSEQIDILYEDEHILLINKPSGLLSLSGKNPLNKDSVHYRMVAQYPDVTMAHRLDFGTSGIMVLALNKAANADLTSQFQKRTMVKTYTAILKGHLPCNEGFINASIAKDKPNFPLQKICNTTGKKALSYYKVVERLQNPETSRVIFSPQTGRTHQLRIHSRKIGHPIIGCDLYGTKLSHSMANRLLLHAQTLEFTHPVTGLKTLGQSPCPF